MSFWSGSRSPRRACSRSPDGSTLGVRGCSMREGSARAAEIERAEDALAPRNRRKGGEAAASLLPDRRRALCPSSLMCEQARYGRLTMIAFVEKRERAEEGARGQSFCGEKLPATPGGAVDARRRRRRPTRPRRAAPPRPRRAPEAARARRSLHPRTFFKRRSLHTGRTKGEAPP